MKNKKAQIDKKRGQVKNVSFKKRSVSKKKAQIKIQQMAFMLIAVTLFFVFVGLFLMGILFSGMKKSSESLEEKNAMALVAQLSNSPEFSCENAFNYGNVNCIDADKVMILKEKQEYSNFWGVDSIQIRKIYSGNLEETIDIECSFENYPNCNLIKINDNSNKGIFKSTFVSLCRKEKNPETQRTYDKCDLAKLMVSYNG
jgi:hypothetical protein